MPLCNAQLFIPLSSDLSVIRYHASLHSGEGFSKVWSSGGLFSW